MVYFSRTLPQKRGKKGHLAGGPRKDEPKFARRFEAPKKPPVNARRDWRKESLQAEARESSARQRGVRVQAPSGGCLTVDGQNPFAPL